MMRKLLVCLFLLLSINTFGLTKVRVTPQWLPQAQFAGIYVAAEKGFYKAEGLDVEIIHPSATKSAIKMLREGQTDIITSQLLEAMTDYEQFPLVNILQTSEHNSLMFITRQPITGPQCLNNKKITRWKAGYGDLGTIYAKQNNISIDWVYMQSNIAIFISGAVDGMMAMEYNEYFQLLMSGVDLKPQNCYLLRDHGFDIPEDGFYTSQKYLKAHPDVVKRFVRATKKGWE